MENIITALERIEEQGSFCTKRTTPIDNLHLEVKDFGLLKFPLTARNAKALIKLAKPAKFGWRDKTLLDKEVRDAWEIPKKNIKITNSAWNKELNSTLELLKNDLGMPETAKLKASLHNLLIYEPGQFFSPHQDSEKLDGMVASLIIVLPSMHSGGTLVIDHQGVKKQFHTSRFPLDKLTCVAFYADCHHEVKSVTEGYRVALTYNLVLETSAKKSLTRSDSPMQNHLIENLRTYFSNEDTDKDPQKLIYLLDHSYTEKGLSWNHLKNVDALRAEALKQAAIALDLEIFMTLADVQETWDCEMEYDDYRYRCRRKHYADEDDNENDIQLTDLIDSNTTLRHWIDANNKSSNYKECYASDSQIAWTKASDEFKPFNSEYEGWMGNYGNTMERWYHRAAIILWRKQDHYPVLFKMDANNVLLELLDLAKKKSNESKVKTIINSLLSCWSEHMRDSSESSLISTALKLAVYVSDSQLAFTMIKDFNIKALNPKTTKLILALQNAYGTAWCLSILKTWSESERYETVKCETISHIASNLLENKINNQEITSWILSYQLETIKTQNVASKKHDSRAELNKDINDRINEIIDFIKACIIVDNHAIHINAINYIINDSELYPILNLINVLNILKSSLKNKNPAKWGYEKLSQYIVAQLENEKTNGLRNIDDWSINEKWSCNCHDCMILSDFLQSKTENKKIWPLAKDRRMHIHRAIDGLAIPVTHETEHTGSPHKLILTKTDKLFAQAKQRFDKVITELCNLTKNIKV